MGGYRLSRYSSTPSCSSRCHLMLPSLPDIPNFPPPARPRARTHPRYRQAQAYKRITRSQSQTYKLNTHQPPHLSHHQPPPATPPRGTCQERVRSVSAARHGQEEKSCCPRRRGGAQRPTPTPAKAPAPSCRETLRRDATRRDAMRGHAAQAHGRGESNGATTRGGEVVSTRRRLIRVRGRGALDVHSTFFR